MGMGGAVPIAFIFGVCDVEQPGFDMAAAARDGVEMIAHASHSSLRLLQKPAIFLRFLPNWMDNPRESVYYTIDGLTSCLKTLFIFLCLYGHNRNGFLCHSWEFRMLN